jgi:uroporphyrinogen-III synthase
MRGRRVALTIDADDAHSPANTLRDFDAYVLHYPVAQTLPPDNYDALDAALERCRQGEADWLLLTTPRAVETVAERMSALKIEPSDFRTLKLALFGAMTRLTANELFPKWQSALPHHHSHEQLVDAMALKKGDRVIVPLAQRTRTDWPDLLAADGASAVTVPAYRLLLGRGGDDLPGLLWGGMVDALVFLSENSVRHFVIRLKIEGGSLDMLDDVVIACLDRQTAAAAEAYSLKVHVVPQEYTTAALAESLAHFFTTERVRA